MTKAEQVRPVSWRLKVLQHAGEGEPRVARPAATSASRKTFYEWRKRYAALGAAGVGDRRRVPPLAPRHGRGVVSKILYLRQNYHLGRVGSRDICCDVTSRRSPSPRCTACFGAMASIACGQSEAQDARQAATESRGSQPPPHSLRRSRYLPRLSRRKWRDRISLHLGLRSSNPLSSAPHHSGKLAAAWRQQSSLRKGTCHARSRF